MWKRDRRTDPMTPTFTPEALTAAGVSPEDVTFYSTARIAYNDAEGWRRLMTIQYRVKEHCRAQESGERV